MTTGTIWWHLGTMILLMGTLTAAAPAAEPPATFGLRALLARLALEAPSETYEYRQHQQSTLLSEAVETVGRITINRGGRIEQVWEGEEGESRLTIDASRAHLITPQRERRFTLAQAPALAALAGALRAIGRGDATALKARFRPRLSGDWSAWNLALKPRETTAGAPRDGGPGASPAPAVELNGQADRLTVIRLRRNGRETEIRIKTRQP